ncbi:MAG: DUF1802 family protein [Chloroflexi bacterium]|nr:DUF1802 family protein [Chloroflexota bacterium]
MKPESTRTGLKEWAVACESLERGQQILLLRKGGIREVRRDFYLEHADFVLYPTYEHQREDLLKPPHRETLASVLARRGAADQVPIRLWAQVTDDIEIAELDQLAVLDDLHCWSSHYAAELLRWKPRHPLHVLALRVYRLPEPLSVSFRPEYGGCSSWVSLAEPIALQGATAVLADEQYGEQLETLKRALARATARSLSA